VAVPSDPLTRTVEHHRSHILEKLGMRDRVELTRYAIRRGLVEP
jgi:DNA-binding NarL/FixJ family response regulator